jgi:hypothetical protein
MKEDETGGSYNTNGKNENSVSGFGRRKLKKIYQMRRSTPTKEDNIKLKLTSCSRVLSEKLKCPKLLKEFPAFYGTRRFITVYTRARHLSLS